MIKIFKGVNLEEALAEARKNENFDENDFYYTIVSQKNNEESVIEIYNLEDVAIYGKEYLKNGINALNMDSEISYNVDKNEKIINISINSSRNSILIGSAGKTLKAFSILMRMAISNKFKRKFRIFLDIGNYRNKKFSHLINLARKVVRESIRMRIDVKLNKMTNEEIEAVCQSLADLKDVKIEIAGSKENDRYIIIRYVGDNKADSEIRNCDDLLNDNGESNDQNYYKNEFQRYNNCNFFVKSFNKDVTKEKNNLNHKNNDFNIFGNLSFLKKNGNNDNNGFKK